MHVLSLGNVVPLAGRVFTRTRPVWMTASPLLARGRWLHLFGLPGVAGVALLAACMAFYLSAVEPAETRMNEVKRNATSVQDRVKAAANGLNQRELPAAAQLAEFYRIFPAEKNLLPWLKKVFDLAEGQGIRLEQGEYRVIRDKVGKLERFQMTLPVRGGYPQIRKYLSTLHAEIPVLSMEHLQFERQKVDDAEVEAKIRLALYVERAQ